MATILKKDLVLKGRGRKTYDWDELFDGKPRRLTRGVDFWCTPNSFRVYAYRAAQRRGIECIAQVDGDTVDLQKKKS